MTRAMSRLAVAHRYGATRRCGPKHVTLVDPMSGGHHGEYASQLILSLVRRGITPHLVGPATLVEAVIERVPYSVAATVVPYQHGVGAHAEVRKLQFVRRTAAVARAVGTDIVHVLSLDRFVGALAVELRRFWPIPTVATLHWVYFSRAVPQQRATSIVRPVERMSARWLLRRGVRIMVHGGPLASVLSTELGGGGIDTIPYPVPPADKPALLPAKARAELGLPPDARLVLAFGGTRQDKGVDLAIRALTHLPEDVHLVVAGRPLDFGPEEVVLIADRLGLMHRVHARLTHVPEEDIDAYFSAVDAVVIPYRRTFSGQSGPLTMAAARGVPIAAADGLMLGETVRRYALGSVFPPEDIGALATALEDVLASPPSPRTGEFVFDHSVDAFVEAVLQSYSRA